MRPKKWVNCNGVCYFQLYEDLYQVIFALDENLSTVIQSPTFKETAIDLIFIIEKDRQP